MTSDGSPYSRLRRAIQHGNLAIIHVTAAELGWVALRDALGILMVIEAKADERFESAAVRWAGRLALEVPDLALAELAGALESLHALPDEHAQRSLVALVSVGRSGRACTRADDQRVSPNHSRASFSTAAGCSSGRKWRADRIVSTRRFGAGLGRSIR